MNKIIFLFISTINLLFAQYALAEIYEFEELEAGKCHTLQFDSNNGDITNTEFSKHGCKPSFLTALGRSAATYSIVIKDIDAEYWDYRWGYKEVFIQKKSDRVVATHKLAAPEIAVITYAINSGKNFNIGYNNGEKWAGGLFGKPSRIDGKKQKSISSDDGNLRSVFNSYAASDRKTIQQVLKILGHYKSGIDGLYGPGTRSAIKSFAQTTEQPLNAVFVLEKLISSKATLAAIKYSDDLNKFGASMLAGAQNLIDQNKCSLSEIKDYGGWVKSGQRKGQYFMDCGNTRHWLNPTSTSGSVTTARHLSESTARDMCWAYIRREIPGASMQALNTSFTKHTAGAVTYTAGFKAKNIYGNTIKYYAYCLIQPDRSMEVTVQQR